MTPIRKLALGLLLPATLVVAGCKDFLHKEGVDTNPNFPTGATRDQLFVAAQSNLFAEQESGIPQFACLIMQACSDVGGRFLNDRAFYGITSDDFNGDFSGIYLGGGLLDLRRIQESATAENDRVYAGIAKVMEAFLVGFAADFWGDIPYSEAARISQIRAPHFDEQTAVYAALQTKLDEAIADLTNGAGPGPGDFDLVYGGDAAKWIQAAHTLKARYYLHTAEVAGPNAPDGGNAFSPAVYAQVIAEANAGISTADNDFLAFHDASTAGANVWYQFSTTSFGQDISAGSVLVDLMNARNDPRLPRYFNRNAVGGFGGNDINAGTPSEEISILGGERINATFKQPLLTYDETQLMLAEAKFRTAGSVAAGQAAALPHVNNVRQRNGLTPLTAGQISLQSIIEEKYIALFQNAEVWNDYKRTCFPRLTPAGATFVPASGSTPAHFEDVAEVIGRVFYGTTEANANPNTPSEPSSGDFSDMRNRNDPNACPAT